jgi:glycosyltransferase involved in cell wall biosynthesis
MDSRRRATGTPPPDRVADSLLVSPTMSIEPRVSVVIPTFNGARRLPRVFDALAAQSAPDGSFEVVVVDNASTDDTAKVASPDSMGTRFKDGAIPCRRIYEARQGTTYARIRGVQESRSGLVCFLDDDNIPDPDYIANGLLLFREPSVGLAVSRVDPKWEIQPSASILGRQHLFAVNQYMGDSAVDFGSSGTIAPTITAGMWVRREVFLSAVPCDRPELLLSGRTGKALACGEDVEIGVLIGGAGYRRVYAPALHIIHEIPATRLAASYVCRLIEGIVRSELTLERKLSRQKYGVGDRIAALVRLMTAGLAAPILLVTRADGLREVIFVMADRWARVKGPFRV